MGGAGHEDQSMQGVHQLWHHPVGEGHVLQHGGAHQQAGGEVGSGHDGAHEADGRGDHRVKVIRRPRNLDLEKSKELN